jgi:hypothetical protein
MPMVFSAIMSPSPPADQPMVFGSFVFALGAVCLIVVWVGLGRVAYYVVAGGVLSNLLLRSWCRR